MDVFNNILKFFQKPSSLDEGFEEFINCEEKNVIILTGAPGVGKTTFGERLKNHLIQKGKNVWISPPISKLVKKEYEIWQTDVKHNTLFYINAVLDKYKEMIDNIFEHVYEYDYIIFDRTHLETTIVTEMYVKDEKSRVYLRDKRNLIKFDKSRVHSVIYFEPTVENMKKRLEERKREGETLNEEFFIEMYNSYKLRVGEIYPEYVLCENNGELEEYDQMFLRFE
jgi:thymidylate kinase